MVPGVVIGDPCITVRGWRPGDRAEDCVPKLGGTTF